MVKTMGKAKEQAYNTFLFQR
uniref:Uncharacterized protein n=1 Tax=Arundo donax TaxID=35708 RepID=A0A0A9E9V6_ARUDO